MSVTTEGTVETIRKESVHSYEDGETCETEFETSKNDGRLFLVVSQEYCNDESIINSSFVLNKSEMLVLYWHLQAVLEKDK